MMPISLKSLITLPGGIPSNNRILRNVVLHPISGLFEQRIIDANTCKLSIPQYTSAILTAAVDTIENLQFNASVAESLSIGDRRYIMLQIAKQLHGDQMWITTRCKECGSMFDISLQRSSIPVKKAASTYPFISTKINRNIVKFRLLNGADHCWIARQTGNIDRREILKRCIVDTDVNEELYSHIDTMNERCIAQIEKLIEDASPDIVTRLDAVCPGCSCRQIVNYDVCSDIAGNVKQLFEEVHLIAMNYHWDEERILMLSRQRRRMYIQMIERHRGLHG